MTILSILTKEETFQLIDFLKTVGISFSGNLTAHEKREVEFYAPIVISRLAFEKMEQLNQNDLIINTDMAFEDMEQISKDNDEFERNHVRDGDMYYDVSEEAQKANLETYYSHHHQTAEPKQSWKVSCDKITKALI